MALNPGKKMALNPAEAVNPSGAGEKVDHAIDRQIQAQEQLEAWNDELAHIADAFSDCLPAESSHTPRFRAEAPSEVSAWSAMARRVPPRKPLDKTQLHIAQKRTAALLADYQFKPKPAKDANIATSDDAEQGSMPRELLRSAERLSGYMAGASMRGVCSESPLVETTAPAPDATPGRGPARAAAPATPLATPHSRTQGCRPAAVPASTPPPRHRPNVLAGVVLKCATSGRTFGTVTGSTHPCLAWGYEWGATCIASSHHGELLPQPLPACSTGGRWGARLVLLKVSGGVSSPSEAGVTCDAGDESGEFGDDYGISADDVSAIRLTHTLSVATASTVTRHPPPPLHIPTCTHRTPSLPSQHP